MSVRRIPFYPYTGKGFQQITDLSNVVGLTLPSVKIFLVMIQAESKDVRWRDDGVDPTSTVGFLLSAGQTLVYDGDLLKFKAIEASSGAILNLGYYE